MLGPRPDNYWAEQVTMAMEALTTAVTESIRQTTTDFLQEGQILVEEKVNTQTTLFSCIVLSVFTSGK